MNTPVEHAFVGYWGTRLSNQAAFLVACLLVFPFVAEAQESVSPTEWRQLSKEPINGKGTIEIRQQFHKDYPVYGSLQKVISGTTTKKAVSGKTVPVYASVPTQIIPSEALIQFLPESIQIQAQPELCWYPTVNNFKLAYQVTGSTGNDLRTRNWFIDAATGKLLKVEDHFCSLDITGTAHTEYHGTKTIGTFQQGIIYQLKSTSRGSGIETLNLNNQMHYGTVSMYSDSDNIWNSGEITPVHHASDAHYCAEAYYDFLATEFSRNSLDNTGLKLVSYMNYGTGFNNAFWNGNAVVYGSGTASTGPMTTLDIAGHEFTHGLIQHMTGLQYSGEPGTINEAVSDMIGAALEFEMMPGQADWLIGEDTGVPLRSMSQPGLYNQPDTYHGNNWYYGTGDNGGVHINSGFLNKWFYLLAEGGSGVNDNGVTYSIQGIGIANATQLVYHTLQSRVVPSTGFFDFRDYTLLTACDLFGSCSPEMSAAADAWKAVGLAVSEVPQIIVLTAFPICAGDTVQLAASGAVYSEFSWQNNGIPIIQNSSQMNLAVTQPGIYTVVESRCGQSILSQPETVEFLATPIISLLPAEGCVGIPIELTASPSGGTFSVASPYTGPSTSFNYLVTGSNGCDAIAHSSIVVHDVPVLQIQPLPAVIHQNELPVSLVAFPVNGIWEGPGYVNGMFDPSVAGIGIHSLTYSVVNEWGCSASETILIEVMEPCTEIETGLMISGTNEAVSPGSRLEFSSGFTGAGLHFEWTVPEGVLVINSTSDSILNVVWGTHDGTVSLTVSNDCSNSITAVKGIKLLHNLPSLSVYPVPAVSEVTVECNHCEAGFVLYDETGREINTGSYPVSGKATLLSGLNPGVYFVVLKNDPTVRKKILITGKP